MRTGLCDTMVVVPARAAAFFDLDKTILAKSSSLAFAKPLYAGGLIGRSAVLKSAYAQLVYLAAGADHEQMERMRVYLSELSRGWDVDQVKAVVAETLDGIVDPIVYVEAVKLIAEHQSAGRDVIIISSSGTEIVEPIGARLGVDKAIGTQMAIEDGKYTGDILFYAYGPGKSEAMRALAAEEGYDLAESYAYSDSYTDLPMLEAVGHPYAVNPDEQLRRVARERVWPILEFDKPQSMHRTISREQRAAASAGAAAGAVALGLAWYSRYRRGR
ncbi:MAG: HAD family hydrolase [Micrococcales bacterium]|nr:HAD family hydrolase [Micrococcales bacterium]